MAASKLACVHSMLSSKKDYLQARDVAEPEFAEILRSNGFAGVRQSVAEEDCSHVDVFGACGQHECKFDVKDLSARWLNSRRYNISADMMEDIAA